MNTFAPRRLPPRTGMTLLELLLVLALLLLAARLLPLLMQAQELLPLVIVISMMVRIVLRAVIIQRGV